MGSKLIKVTDTTADLSNLIGMLVKYAEHSGWYKFGGVANDLFIILDRNGNELIKTNVIYIKG